VEIRQRAVKGPSLFQNPSPEGGIFRGKGGPTGQGRIPVQENVREKERFPGTLLEKRERKSGERRTMSGKKSFPEPWKKNNGSQGGKRRGWKEVYKALLLK